jgi:hypothetical protein
MCLCQAMIYFLLKSSKQNKTKQTIKKINVFSIKHSFKNKSKPNDITNIVKRHTINPYVMYLQYLLALVLLRYYVSFCHKLYQRFDDMFELKGASRNHSLNDSFCS